MKYLFASFILGLFLFGCEDDCSNAPEAHTICRDGVSHRPNDKVTPCSSCHENNDTPNAPACSSCH